MPPPTLFVMSTEATGPRSDRRPAGVIHAAPTTHPPENRTLCGQASDLFWFGHVDFHDRLDARRCPECTRLAVVVAKLDVRRSDPPPA